MPAELEDWAKAAARRWSETGRPDDEPLAALVLGVAASAARFRSDYEEAGRLAGLSLRLLDADDPFRRYAVYVQAELALLSGDLDEALRLYSDVRRWAEMADDELRSGYTRAALVLVFAYGGQLGEGGHRGDRPAGDVPVLRWSEAGPCTSWARPSSTPSPTGPSSC